MMPYLPPFDPNVFPKKTRVICSKGESGKIIQSKVVDQVVYYDIELDASGERILEQEVRDFHQKRCIHTLRTRDLLYCSIPTFYWHQVYAFKLNPMEMDRFYIQMHP